MEILRLNWQARKKNLRGLAREKDCRAGAVGLETALLRQPHCHFVTFLPEEKGEQPKRVVEYRFAG